MTVPDFTPEGVLPPGDYELTFTQLRTSMLVSGPTDDSCPNWDARWRLSLVGMAEVLVGQLWAEGVKDVFLDGSFVERKAHPNDIDGYFVCAAEAIEDLRLRLNERDPHKCWNWARDSRTFDPNSAKRQLPMWHAYRTELYPHYGNQHFCGILGPTGQPLTFPDAFRRRRGDSLSKGIIRIVPERDGTP